jgi:oxygen-independent coproporphyrinogen-3 oxidase
MPALNKRKLLTDSPPWLHPRAAYIHIPFCAHRCGYCDFAIAVGQDHAVDLYLDALAAEIQSTVGSPQPVRTMFLGGGTPTLLSAQQLERLLKMLLHWLPLDKGGELTIEANPHTITPEKVRVLADHGVNRLSLGAQSFQPDRLRFLERDHVPSDTIRAVELARPHIPAISLDLIFGTPHQTVETWRADLDQALSLQPDHISTYGLTYEKGTPLWKERRAGHVQPLDEQCERELYETTMDRLEDAGFEHYEISSFARPGHRCRHNEAYWANWAHWGFGMGAAGYTNGRRHLNTRDLRTYMKRALSGELPAAQVETLEPHDRANETLAIQLRRADGIDRNRFLDQTGFSVDELAGTAIAHLVDLGLLANDTGSIRLTRQGKFVADSVIEELFRKAMKQSPRSGARPPRATLKTITSSSRTPS